MPAVHAHCDGCGKDIQEEDDSIIQVIKGVTEIQGSQMNVSWKDEVWFGHASCHVKPLNDANVFLHGEVYRKLHNWFNNDLLKGKLEDFFKSKGWPMKELK